MTVSKGTLRSRNVPFSRANQILIIIILWIRASKDIFQVSFGFPITLQIGWYFFNVSLDISYLPTIEFNILNYV